MTGSGVPAEAAAEMVAALDEVMSACILGLYRSAVPNAHAGWGALAQAATPAPGLILVPADDRVDDEERSRQVADRLRARVAVLDGMNHWWMYDRTGKVASVLEGFWATAG
ncbi:hypothetical protein SAMN05421874_1117 [Nonomuraea maritima]|uniref:Alpha/beta hydrolase family protein n=1 Tax=Nonomuraea maritima TaxID=683260 RepID=A0A1G9EJ51_9ACTN|nr:hypothetical protein [Nonomuraea maritima]SDK76182.1 hypothetical protein SAMN05421874_1117 [Nonomuraea maritima]